MGVVGAQFSGSPASVRKDAFCGLVRVLPGLFVAYNTVLQMVASERIVVAFALMFDRHSHQTRDAHGASCQKHLSCGAAHAARLCAGMRMSSLKAVFDSHVDCGQLFSSPFKALWNLFCAIGRGYAEMRRALTNYGHDESRLEHEVAHSQNQHNSRQSCVLWTAHRQTFQ